MDARMTSRDWWLLIIGTVLLVGGLFALSFTVYLDEYDKWGVQVECGNGYSTQLLHATVDDQVTGGRSASGASHVDRCNSAVAHRRAWTLPVTGLGVVILASQAVVWARSRATEPDSSTEAWSEAPDDYMHEAAALDRRERPYRERPPNTTM